MAWVFLFLAGLLEIGWAVGLRSTHGFTKFWPSVATVAAIVASFLLLASALKTIPVGTGYAIWTGIGVVGTVVTGMAFHGEPRDVGRILCLLMIVSGIIGLKMVSPHGR